MNLYGTCFRIGVGIHVGEAVVGTVGMVGYGENAKMRTTAIGDAVNFASRIESENKAAGTSLLISQCAFSEVKDKVLTGKTIEVDIKGKTGKYILYEVVGLKP